MKRVEHIMLTGVLVPAIAAGIVGCSVRVGPQGGNSAAVATASAPPPSTTVVSAPGVTSNPSVDAAQPSWPPAHCLSSAPYAKSVRSPDGKTVVFVYEDPSQDWRGVHPQTLCITTEGMLPRFVLEGTNFGTFLFSPDGKTLYFSADEWETSQAAHALDLPTGKERLLVDGWVQKVFTQGPYKGMLLVSHFRLDPFHSVNSTEWRGRIPTASIMRQTVRRCASSQKMSVHKGRCSRRTDLSLRSLVSGSPAASIVCRHGPCGNLQHAPRHSLRRDSSRL
jgi:hypothetical protein